MEGAHRGETKNGKGNTGVKSVLEKSDLYSK